MSEARYSAVADGDIIVLRDREVGASARIDVAHGANVVSFVTRVSDREIAVLAPRGIPILFPFPNRVPDGRFAWRGREHRLDVNERGRPNHNHGLVRDRPWQVASVFASSQLATVRASIDLGGLFDVMRQYPFPCTVDVVIALIDGGLWHDAFVTNDGEEPMPMGYGIHPWFPAALSGARASTEVRVPARSFWELEEKIPTGRTLAVHDRYDLREWRALGEHTYDDVFTSLDRRVDAWSVAGVRYPADGLELLLEASPTYREWVLFADPDRDAIAVEPYSCVTNAINLEPRGIDAGLVALDPGAIWQASLAIRPRAIDARA